MVNCSVGSDEPALTRRLGPKPVFLVVELFERGHLFTGLHHSFHIVRRKVDHQMFNRRACRHDPCI